MEEVNLSPAQLLMGRRPRNKFPFLRELLTPTKCNRQDVMQRLNQQKAHQKFYHESKSVSDLPPLLPGDQVRMAPSPGSKRWNPAIVIKRHVSPCSYIVESGGQDGTTATEDTYIDQPKLPILLNTTQISQQMTVHPIWTTISLPHRPRNPATAHQANNRNLRQPLVLKPPNQTSRTQPEVVARFAALRDLTYRVTNWHYLYKYMCTVLCSFKNTDLSAIRRNHLLLLTWGHWTLLSSALFILGHWFIYSRTFRVCLSQVLFRLLPSMRREM